MAGNLTPQEEYEHLRRLGGMDIFDMDHGRDLPGGFMFVIPHTAISSRDVSIRRDLEAHEWVLEYEDAGRTWVGRHENLTAAYLDLIANRLALESEDD